MRRQWIPRQKGEDEWEDKGYMGASFDEIVREAKEDIGLTRGGERFQQEKRQRTGEGPVVIEMQDREGRPHGTKRPYSDDEDNQDTPCCFLSHTWVMW